MSKYFRKVRISRLVVVGIMAFLSIMLIAHQGIERGKEGRDMALIMSQSLSMPILSKIFHLYLCAFHIAKDNPNFKVEAHHYCSMRDLKVGKGDLHQCVIYDSKEAPAKLLGIEYIISDETYQMLPHNEKIYWHPHAYEIVSRSAHCARPV